MDTSASDAFDEARAHRYFSAHCFNKAWELLNLKTRTEQQDREMFELSQASLWHWSQRADCTDENLAAGYWQASRVQAVLGNGESARAFAELSRRFAATCDPFYQAYAVEALARSEVCYGNEAAARAYREQALEMSGRIENTEHRQWLLADLDTVLVATTTQRSGPENA